MSSRSTSNEKGAAEERGPEADGSLSSSSSSSTASYDPTVFQRPHPDDRAAADGTPRKKGDGKAKKSKDKAQGKTKDGKGKTVGRCGNCDAEGAKMKCSQCGTEVYCDENCQRVHTLVVTRAEGFGDSSLEAVVFRPVPSHILRLVPTTRSTGGTAATRRRARPTCSPTPSRRSRTGCARRRSRLIAV